MNETFSILLGFFIMAAIIVGAVLYGESLVVNEQGIAAHVKNTLQKADRIIIICLNDLSIN